MKHGQEEEKEEAKEEDLLGVLMKARPKPDARWQEEPSLYVVDCPEHGKVYGTNGEALWAMTRLEQFLVCPKCDQLCLWHDETEMKELPVTEPGHLLEGIPCLLPMKLLESLGFRQR